MKILTLNFLTCARKACKPSASSFPLHPRDCELEVIETDFNILFLRNILPRLDWGALVTMASELGIPGLKAEMPEGDELVVVKGMDGEGEGKVKAEEEGEGEGEATQLARDLHRLLLETTIQSGKLVCGNCGHEYAVKEGIANFLLPSHLV